jgi:hypothetical protein
VRGVGVVVLLVSVAGGTCIGRIFPVVRGDSYCMSRLGVDVSSDLPTSNINSFASLALAFRLSNPRQPAPQFK